MTNVFLPIIIGVVVFLIAMAIFRSIIRAGLICLFALMLFRVSWVYSADELFNKWKLREIISEEYQDDIYEKYDTYSKKRDSNSIIDAKKIDNNIRRREDEIKVELENKVNEKRKEKQE